MVINFIYEIESLLEEIFPLLLEGFVVCYLLPILFGLIEFDFEDLVVVLEGDEDEGPLEEQVEVDFDGAHQFGCLVVLEQGDFAVELNHNINTTCSAVVKLILKEVLSSRD